MHSNDYRHWREQYPWLIDSEVQVVDDDSKPLYELFAESKAQVVVYSTALIEGLAFGNKNFNTTVWRL